MMRDAEIRKAYAERAANAPAELLKRLRDADMPEAGDAFALSKLALRLDGFRLLFVSWVPRPAIEPNEQAGFFEALDDLIGQQITLVVSEQTEHRARTAAYVQRKLQEWNRTREAFSDKPTKEAIAAMKDKDPANDEWVRVDLGGGRYVMEYHPRVNPADDAMLRRIERERAERTGQ